MMSRAACIWRPRRWTAPAPCWMPPVIRIACRLPMFTTAMTTRRIPLLFRERHAGLARRSQPYVNMTPKANGLMPARLVGNIRWSIPYNGQPYFVSEFGGIWWNPDVKAGEDSWGYGTRPRDLDEFYNRFEKLCAILLDDVNMFGYCYTQVDRHLSRAERHLQIRSRAQV